MPHRPDDGSDGLGGVPAAFGLDTDLVQLGVGGVGAERADRIGQALPWSAGDLRRDLGGRSGGELGRSDEWRCGGEADERVEKIQVAGVAQGGEHHGAGLAGFVLQASQQPGGTGGIDVRQGGDVGGEAGGEHVGVPDRADHAAEPAELGTDGGEPIAIQQRGEAAQVRAQPAGGDTELVDVLGIVAEPDTRVVAEDRGHGAGHSVSHQVDDGGVGGQAR